LGGKPFGRRALKRKQQQGRIARGAKREDAAAGQITSEGGNVFSHSKNHCTLSKKEICNVQKK
jgi:hypothetical protein